jgi:hypothetical protein
MAEGSDYFDYMRRMGKTTGTIGVALLVPVILTIKFAVPDY